MKILDLGCQDGYLTLWLAREMKQRGVEVRVDGIELHTESAQVARERFVEFDGKVVAGDALDAESHFEAGTYDAVVAFELIEHVLDPDRLLEVCEAMLKPDGRIYISTPDGTFGEGNNPHHLRVYRAHDLADLLRRRGQLTDMAVGPDNVTVASYTPKPRRGEIAIYTGGAWEPWSPIDIERKGLGGSETAAVRLAEQLSELGFVVTVYGEVDQMCYRDVIFRHHSVYDPEEPRLAVIASRLPEVFDRPPAAKVRCLWLHDTDAGDRLTQNRADSIDHVFVLSRWHEKHVGKMYPFLRDKLRRIRNGITPEYFEGEQPEREKRVLYTSSPDRGLDLLLEMWPEVLKEVPDAKLEYCYSAVYDAVAKERPEVAEHAAKVAEMAKQPGVTALGSLTQPQLAKLMRASLVWAHPSWATPHNMPFHETSCIGAMEAQAAGLLPVASKWGALSETVVAGRLINSKPLGPRWRAAFIREIIDGLTNPETQEWVQRRGPEVAADLGWDGVARHVAGYIEGEQFAFEGQYAKGGSLDVTPLNEPAP